MEKTGIFATIWTILCFDYKRSILFASKSCYNTGQFEELIYIFDKVVSVIGQYW